MLETTGLTKTFGGVTALEDVDFDLRAGEVHALLGENGAGKSTLINLVSGSHSRTRGTIAIGGDPVEALTPQKARALGVAAVFQEFSLVPELSVVENLFLGNELRAGPFLRKGEMRKRASSLLDRLGFRVPLDIAVADLTRAQRQMVEIAKALRGSSRVLILDEPTASLTDGEAEKLFAAVAKLKAEGVGIIYVSHRMSEIRSISDRVTVLRGGQKIATVNTADATDADLIEMMVGRPVDELFPPVSLTPGDTRIELEGLSTASGRVRDVTLHARAGEIVGLAGLAGCGRSDLCRAIFGLESVASGTIRFSGEELHDPTPHHMLRKGLCYFPADRGAEGLAMIRPARENVTMAGLNLPGLAAGPALNIWAERSAIRSPLDELGLRPMEPERRATEFSGGNQQKVMLARGLLKEYDVYLFDEPTVGIDVNAKRDVYALIKRLAEGGATVILSTSEVPELTHLANRIYVMHEGRVMAELDGEGVTEKDILSHYFGEVAHA